jgi:hypothetical protein
LSWIFIFVASVAAFTLSMVIVAVRAAVPSNSILNEYPAKAGLRGQVD